MFVWMNLCVVVLFLWYHIWEIIAHSSVVKLFSCRSFIVLAIAFRSLIHFELILYNFCVQCKIRTCFYSFACGCPVFSIYLWQDCVSALKHTLLAPLSKVAHHCLCEGLFWGSVFYSLVSSCQYNTVLIRVTL